MGSPPRGPAGVERLLALRLLHPEQWVAVVYQAMADSEGRVPAAAERLGISERVLYQWLKENRVLDGAARAPMGRPKPGTDHPPRRRKNA